MNHEKFLIVFFCVTYIKERLNDNTIDFQRSYFEVK